MVPLIPILDARVCKLGYTQHGERMRQYAGQLSHKVSVVSLRKMTYRRSNRGLYASC